MRSSRLRLELSVFLTLLGSYAYFWHARDWNASSRLILTYALFDSRTVCLDGLDQQTGDIALFHEHYYCDKLPGFSFAATVPYGLARSILGLPPHPLAPPPPPRTKALAHWPADYWTTLGTSGLFTAACAILLMRLARRLGCSPRAAAVVALAYGLATPAYVYATLAYGHQLSAFALLGSFCLIWTRGAGREVVRMLAAGFLAAYASVIELQLGPVSAILGIWLVFQCLAGRRRGSALFFFALGAALPTLALLVYNDQAFGSPWELGYFHHARKEFAEVHNRQNPLGLRSPDLSKVIPLLWGEHRGLLFYAPILLLAVPGWIVLCLRRQFALAASSLAIVLAVFLVNLSYPEWTGGWSTGPRLLLPLLPFAMIPVAAALTGPSRWRRLAFALAVVLALAGGILMLLYQGVGARIPHEIDRPLRDFVWPLWTGQMRTPGWWSHDRFAWNLCSLAARDWIDGLSPSYQALQFLPLVGLQALAMLGINVLAGAEPSRPVGNPQATSTPSA
ncbi:MAG: hypothetical protein ACP5XB_26675 [Isosphaeraceae bacterium]